MPLRRGILELEISDRRTELSKGLSKKLGSPKFQPRRFGHEWGRPRNPTSPPWRLRFRYVEALREIRKRLKAIHLRSGRSC
jgi:hypothetical protein